MTNHALDSMTAAVLGQALAQALQPHLTSTRELGEIVATLRGLQVGLNRIESEGRNECDDLAAALERIRQIDLVNLAAQLSKFITHESYQRDLVAISEKLKALEHKLQKHDAALQELGRFQVRITTMLAILTPLVTIIINILIRLFVK